MTGSPQPAYLQPYERAVKRHGPEFRALLWASPRTQTKRFDALLHLQDPTGLAILDLGCGRADLLDYLISIGRRPRRYFGIEGVAALADAAENKRLPHARIIRADFLREPRRLDVQADVVYCSGALNTLDNDDFHRGLACAFAAAKQALIFNFLSSPLLAGVNYLRWHEPAAVMRFARTLTSNVKRHEGYLEGDCTIGMWK